MHFFVYKFVIIVKYWFKVLNSNSCITSNLHSAPWYDFVRLAKLVVAQILHPVNRKLNQYIYMNLLHV